MSINGSQKPSNTERSQSATATSLRGKSNNEAFWKSPAYLSEFLLTTLLLVAAGWLGSLFDIDQLPLRCFRPTIGLGYVVMWQRGLNRWPAILLSSFLTTALIREQTAFAPNIAIAVAEVLVLTLNVWQVRRSVLGRNPSSRLPDSLKFVLYGSLTFPSLSAFLSTALAEWLSPIAGCSFYEQFFIRWQAQALTILIVTPIGFAWWGSLWNSKKANTRWWEIALFGIALACLAAWTFGRNIASNSLPIPDVVLVVPISFWALVRWGMRGNSVCTLAISLMSLIAALHGRGPFIRDGSGIAYSTLILVMGNSIIFSATTFLTAALMEERREAAAALQKIDVRYQILFQNSPDAVFVIAMDNEDLLEFNNQLPEMLKCTRADLRGKNRSDFELDPQEQSFSWASSVLSVTKIKTADFDTKFRCRNGDIIDVNVTFSVIDFFGRQAQLMIARNVTERRKAEQKLIESEEKFRVLAESIPLLVTIQRDQRPLYVNPAMIAVSGYSQEELRQKNLLDLLRGAERDELERRLQRNPSYGSTPWQREVSLFTKLGSERKVELTVTAIRLEERHSWLASAVDITERRKAEAELRQRNAELFHTARLRLLGEFVAGVAHDLKHPIGAIDLSTTAMINRLNSGKVFSTEELLTEFEFLLSQAQKGIARIVRLEDLSRRHETERRLIDLPPLIGDASRLVRLNRQWSDVPIKLETESPLPKVYVDRAEMTQVLLDLFRNSLEAMSELPEPERRIAVTIKQENAEFVRMTITDFGCGIPEVVQKKMFRAFNSSKADGLGLGLSLCHTVVAERHRGELIYEPTQPRGTTFHILLPTSHSSSWPRS